MSLLFEAIKVKDGQIYNLDYHSSRMNITRKELFNTGPALHLENKIILPAFTGKGIFTCRIEYNDHIRKIDFQPYVYRRIRTLKLVEVDDIDYSFKFINRNVINKLMVQKNGCDDILMVRNGMITDTSCANIIVRGNDNIWYTPSSYIMRGTKREYLLNHGLIREKILTPASLKRYRELRLINSMLDIEDTDSIPVRTICF
jgi:4-amino-4-deoxychorismate lyase